MGTSQSITHKPRKSSPSLRSLVTGKLSSADISGAVRILSSSDKIVAPSLEALRKLEEKHPPPHFKLDLPPTCDSDNILCTKDEVKKALQSFKPGSGREVLTDSFHSI